MMSVQKRMEEALAQQTILDLARKVGRKSPAEFPAQVDQWINERREKKCSTQAAAERNIPLCDISG